MVATINKKPKPVSIDFVLSDDHEQNAMIVAMLRKSTDKRALDYVEARLTAIERNYPSGSYRAEKRRGRWYFTPQPQSYVLSRSNP